MWDEAGTVIEHGKDVAVSATRDDGDDSEKCLGVGNMGVFVGPIRDIVHGIYDGPHATPPEADAGPVFLGIANVDEGGRLDLADVRHVSEEHYPKWTRRVTPQANDIVFSYEATLHRYALIPEGFRGCLGRRMALIRPDVRKVVPRFLHYYFLSSGWRSVVEGNVVSGATVDRIPLLRFPDFQVRLPELFDQHRIADILSAYDDLIENNRRRIQLLEAAAAVPGVVRLPPLPGPRTRGDKCGPTVRLDKTKSG
jgi:type I restriction enzyme S subunit